ncbi:hypothetical protein [Flavobacterium psychrophilum]|uniref:hypothetical protein n=1 Tax=Flavobacterium psychrophilum TaxID=96345 RepID=UPI001C8F1E6E|nr:hypothetical protein [Flavobacterium psychrophilum]QZK98521.1 hypothetical protein K5L05_02220 [Flavobacterium psychrophilum]
MKSTNQAINYSPEWWDEFLNKTNNLTKTSIFSECMDSEETKSLRMNVLQIIQTLAKLRTNKYGYRVYVDGKIQDNNEMNKIYDSPPLDNEIIEDWVKRVFGEKKFGMIINLGEKFNLDLSKKIALKTEPYLEKIGFPREGINFSIFVGNYDKTPLGIHKDPPGQDVMHFHLGPGDKTMYTWGRNEFEDLIDNKKFDKLDVESLLPYSTEFSFKEGDMYYMPEGEYHIGKQDGLSIALTFWRYNHTKDKLAKKLQNVVFSQFLQKNDDLLATDKNDLNDISGLDETLKIFEIPTEMENMNLKDLMKEAYKDLRYSIHSNAGYRTSPFPIEEDILFNLEDVIQLEKPFKILFKESLNKQKLHVYVRGIKIELNNFECIISFLNEINTGNLIKIKDLLNVLDESWDKEIGLYMLSLIYKNHGIVIKNK